MDDKSDGEAMVVIESRVVALAHEKHAELTGRQEDGDGDRTENSRIRQLL